MSLGWARMTIAALEAAGVRDVVICPGSRSAPLAVAAARSSLRVTAIIDERSAAFFALGQARATGRPSALLCTSGTAGAHFYPAVIEASHASVPLIAITADRPPELQGCGASQTIDQSQLFGGFVRAHIDLGCARTDPGSERALVSAVARAVVTARGPRPGPVHINAPARKPLLAGTDAARSLDLDFTSHTPPALEPDAAALAKARARLAAAERPLLVAGPIAPTDADAIEAIATLATQLGAPLFAESSSQLRFGHPHSRLVVSDFDALLRADGFRSDPPDLILELGEPPTSAGYARALAAHPAIHRVVFRASTATDPARSADAVIVGNLATSAAALTPSGKRDDLGDSTRRWLDRGAEAAAKLEPHLRGEELVGQAAMRAIVSSLPPRSQLVIGNSLPIRWLDQACPASEVPCSVHSQRGVAGIDGLIAGAAGAAAGTRAPTCLVLGDVSAAHDIGSLAISRDIGSPLVICVLDNRGGQIFSELPYASDLDPALLESVFTTEPTVDFVAAARAFGIHPVAVSSARALADQVLEAIAAARTTLIHCTVTRRSPEVLA